MPLSSSKPCSMLSTSGRVFLSTGSHLVAVTNIGFSQRNTSLANQNVFPTFDSSIICLRTNNSVLTDSRAAVLLFVQLVRIASAMRGKYNRVFKMGLPAAARSYTQLQRLVE